MKYFFQVLLRIEMVPLDCWESFRLHTLLQTWSECSSLRLRQLKTELSHLCGFYFNMIHVTAVFLGNTAKPKWQNTQTAQCRAIIKKNKQRHWSCSKLHIYSELTTSFGEEGEPWRWTDSDDFRQEREIERKTETERERETDRERERS